MKRTGDRLATTAALPRPAVDVTPAKGASSSSIQIMAGRRTAPNPDQTQTRRFFEMSDDPAAHDAAAAAAHEVSAGCVVLSRNSSGAPVALVMRRSERGSRRGAFELPKVRAGQRKDSALRAVPPLPRAHVRMATKAT